MINIHTPAVQFEGKYQSNGKKKDQLAKEAKGQVKLQNKRRKYCIVKESDILPVCCICLNKQLVV